MEDNRVLGDYRYRHIVGAGIIRCVGIERRPMAYVAIAFSCRIGWQWLRAISWTFKEGLDMKQRHALSALGLLLVLTCALPAGTGKGSGYLLLDLSDWKDGSYPIVVTVKNGRASARPLPVTKLDGTSPVIPDPGIPTPPAGETAKKIAQWATAANDPTTTRGLSGVCSSVLSGVEDGSIPPNKAMPALSAGFNAAYGFLGSRIKWKSVRENLTALVADQKQRGKLDTKAEVVTFLKDVKNGLDSTTSTARVRDRIDFEKLLRFMEVILPLILKIIAGIG